MMKLKKILIDKSGLAAPIACVIVIAIVLIMTSVSEYIRLQIIAKGVRDALQSAVISVATGNYDKVYIGLREGYAGGYKLSSYDTWKENVDKGGIYDYLDNLLVLSKVGSSHVKMVNGRIEYRLYGMDVGITNGSFAPDDPNTANKFSTNVKITLEVPVYLGSVKLFPMKITLKVKAGYSPKF